jgi:hypothetical protein
MNPVQDINIRRVANGFTLHISTSSGEGADGYPKFVNTEMIFTDAAEVIAEVTKLIS